MCGLNFVSLQCSLLLNSIKDFLQYILQPYGFKVQFIELQE
jgi:hypothetical protein